MRYTTGDILSAETEALVNPVNTVGVMGKGLALQFKRRFPNNFKVYKDTCMREEVKTGKMFVFKEVEEQGEKLIINFPVQTHWRKKSEYSYIVEGLKDLVAVIEKDEIKSISVPALGCEKSGLDWGKVKNLIEKYLGDLEDVEVVVYEPG